VRETHDVCVTDTHVRLVARVAARFGISVQREVRGPPGARDADRARPVRAGIDAGDEDAGVRRAANARVPRDLAPTIRIGEERRVEHDRGVAYACHRTVDVAEHGAAIAVSTETVGRAGVPSEIDSVGPGKAEVRCVVRRIGKERRILQSPESARGAERVRTKAGEVRALDADPPIVEFESANRKVAFERFRRTRPVIALADDERIAQDRVVARERDADGVVGNRRVREAQPRTAQPRAAPPVLVRR